MTRLDVQNETECNREMRKALYYKGNTTRTINYPKKQKGFNVLR